MRFNNIEYIMNTFTFQVMNKS